MSTPITNIQACKCKKQEKQRNRQRMSFLLTVIVAILPKCPFCAFGYSSVLVMCSGAKIHQYEANSMGYLSIILAVAVLVSLFWNYKGRKTLVAATVATLGILPLIYAQIFSGNPLEYFVGTALILLAVLLNGRWFRKFGF
jgi:ABC-type antimicrobial peptide transport system permease subunit